MVTEGYRGSPPLPPTPPAKTCQPGRNLGGTWEEPGANLGGSLRSMGFRLFLRYVCVFVRLLAFLRACWDNIASSRANIARRWPHLAPKTDQHSPKTTQHSPRWANIAPRWTNKASKMGQHGVNMLAKPCESMGFSMVFAFGFFVGSTSGQDWTTYVSDGPTWKQHGAA